MSSNMLTEAETNTWISHSQLRETGQLTEPHSLFFAS